MSFNPERLALARRRRGLSKRELAELACVSDRSLTCYELGQTVPTDETIAALAKALEFPVEFFDRPNLDPLPEKSVSFRALSKMTARQSERATAGGRIGLELSDFIESRFTLPTVDIPEVRGANTPEQAAIAVRGAWGLGDKPIGHMLRLIESRGVRVFSLAEDCVEVDAFSFWRGERPFMFLNTLKSSEHGRFDTAHELGHLVLHRHGQPIGRQAEKEADAFASAFLMPQTSVIAHAPRFPTVEALISAKRIWNVSVAALAYRMHSIGLVSDWTYRGLQIDIGAKGFRKNEPDSAPREMSQALEKVFHQLREEGVSKRDVAKALGWPVREVDALVFGLILAARGGGAASTGSKRGDQLKLVNYKPIVPRSLFTHPHARRGHRRHHF
jgi:Zn-dependent peptidase ImmA (M78 family)/DNA-binding XRE family transcriptional regulator